MLALGDFHSWAISPLGHSGVEQECCICRSQHRRIGESGTKDAQEGMSNTRDAQEGMSNRRHEQQEQHCMNEQHSESSGDGQTYSYRAFIRHRQRLSTIHASFHTVLTGHSIIPSRKPNDCPTNCHSSIISHNHVQANRQANQRYFDSRQPIPHSQSQQQQEIDHAGQQIQQQQSYESLNNTVQQTHESSAFARPCTKNAVFNQPNITSNLRFTMSFPVVLDSQLTWIDLVNFFIHGKNFLDGNLHGVCRIISHTKSKDRSNGMQDLYSSVERLMSKKKDMSIAYRLVIALMSCPDFLSLHFSQSSNSNSKQRSGSGHEPAVILRSIMARHDKSFQLDNFPLLLAVFQKASSPITATARTVLLTMAAMLTHL